MHFGRIENDTAAGRVFKLLRANAGEWIDAWTLTLACRTTAISTRISEIRHQLVADERYAIESLYEDGKWYYRVVELVMA